MTPARWKKAQKAEQAFWKWLDRVYSRSSFLDDVRAYFLRILELTGIDFNNSQRYLDIGSGPTTVFLAMDKGTRIALDPLMNYYLKQFPHLADLKHVEWVAEKIEAWKNKEPFNAVFMFNCLNHCEDLGAIVKQLTAFSGPDGHLIVTQHCHTQEWTRNFFTRTNRIFDTCHPHHFLKEDVIRLFKDNFTLLKETAIDHLDVERAQKTGKSLTKKPLFTRIANAVALPHRLDSYVYALVGRWYKKQLAGRPIIANHLFVFKKTGARP